MNDQITSSKQPRLVESKAVLQKQYLGLANVLALLSVWVVWQRTELTDLGSVHGWLNCIIAFSALSLLAFPSRSLVLVLLCGLHLAYAVFEMPFARSHEMLLGFFCCTVVISYITGVARHRRFAVSGVSLYRSFSPALRLMFVGSLAMIGLMRANWSFIDTNASSVVQVLTEVRGSPLDDWLVLFTISMLIVVDLCLAVFLLVPSMRRFAVGLGSCYFGWQAWVGLGDAAFLYPVFLLGFYCFLSPDFIAKTHARVQCRIPVPAFRRYGLAGGVMAIALVGCALWIQQKQAAAEEFAKLVGLAFAAATATVILLVFQSMIGNRPKLTWVSLSPKNVAHYAVLAIFVAFFASPFLGVGNSGRFGVGSGFAAAWHRNNHFFLPQATLTEFEKDWVEIKSSSDSYLAWLAANEMRLTWFELVNYLEPRPETSVRFRRGNDDYDVKRAGDIDVICEANPWWLRKLVHFEPMPAIELDDFMVPVIAKVE